MIFKDSREDIEINKAVVSNTWFAWTGLDEWIDDVRDEWIMEWMMGGKRGREQWDWIKDG